MTADGRDARPDEPRRASEHPTAVQPREHHLPARRPHSEAHAHSESDENPQSESRAHGEGQGAGEGRTADAGRPPGEVRPPEERGRTTISDRVVERIVAKAAEETAGSGGLDRTVLGVGLPGRRAARTDVRVHGKVVTARVALSVEYPMPVRDVARRVRAGVRARVEALTGLTVRQVDIDVAELERPAGRTVS